MGNDREDSPYCQEDPVRYRHIGKAYQGDRPQGDDPETGDPEMVEQGRVCSKAWLRGSEKSQL